MARSPGIYYDPSVHDYGSKLVQGGLAGLAMGRNVQEIEMNKMKMDEAKKMQAVKDEIAAAHKEYIGAVKAPEGGMDPTQAGMIAMDQQQAIQAEGVPTGQETPAIAERVAAEGQKPQGFAGLLAEKQATQVSEEAKAKPLVAKAQFMTKAKEIFEKHGMVDQAMAIENNYMKHVGTIATTIGKKAAFKELKQGMLKDSFQDMTEADIEDKGDHFQIEKVGPNNDGIVKFNKKEGTIEIVKEPTAKVEKEVKEVPFDLYREGKRKAGWSDDKIAEGWAALQHPRKEGGGAAGKAEKWTIPKIRAEWDKAEAGIGKRIKEIQTELAAVGEEQGPDQKAASPLNTELDSLRKVQRNIPTYRDNDADAVKRGYDPINYGKVARYIGNPEVGAGQAAGKVSGETQGLLKGKYTKVVEDPKTKKRYGVKPDGTKEPL